MKKYNLMTVLAIALVFTMSVVGVAVAGDEYEEAGTGTYVTRLQADSGQREALNVIDGRYADLSTNEKRQVLSDPRPQRKDLGQAS